MGHSKARTCDTCGTCGPELRNANREDRPPRPSRRPGCSIPRALGGPRHSVRLAGPEGTKHPDVPGGGARRRGSGNKRGSLVDGKALWNTRFHFYVFCYCPVISINAKLLRSNIQNHHQACARLTVSASTRNFTYLLPSPGLTRTSPHTWLHPFCSPDCITAFCLSQNESVSCPPPHPCSPDTHRPAR